MLRTSLDSLPASRIREVANAALGRDDIVKFWFGEGDLPTPEFIRAAAKQALDAGETFYNHNLGIAELRQAIADYASKLHGVRIESDRIAVTSAGVNALSLIAQALFDPGDRVAIVTPVWPNLTSIPRIMGAEVVRVPLACRDGVWSLDLQKLIDAAAPGTRAVLVNSPNNPTGWTMPQADWNALLAHCRRHGIWLVSDDAYERLVYTGAPHAPGVLARVEDGERFISANTFSKSWTMTGWRLGWLIAPSRFVADFGKLVEFNTSCAPPFVQRAGIVAIRDGDPLIRDTVARLKRSRDLLVQRLRALPGVEAAAPPGAMYLFFRIPGRSDDSLAFAKELVTRSGLGLAPGIAFGAEGEGYLRWCFAATEALIEQGVERLARHLR
ncbi:aminotransferase class I/II-fold pyridoxal phosphate-dependent enzyme [Betaproteobacteria bacterium PRO7]|jgi:aspartate/methionine/tyrosine aminotransferase|nr:aminotransferase class I/II-fold pyridoxal phosphate-dependent enzyme [Betaproteobacteria bacterium PRO7]